MRDPERIERICGLVQKAWERVPAQRFGQFLSNMLGDIVNKNKVYDIWFPEDDKWEEWLEEYTNK